MYTIKSLDNNIVIDDENYNLDKWIFSIHLKNKYCTCPNCNNKTKSIHSFHDRKIQDLPIQNKTVYLNIRMRHMICRKCKTIFTESLSFADNKAHMTNRLKEHIIVTSIPNSSLISEKQLQMEGIKIKKSTICTLLKKRRTNPNQ